MVAATIRIVPQDEIGHGTSDPPRLRLPPATLFADRADRFRAIVLRDHPDRAYLVFLARLCAAQDRALGEHAPGTLPDAEHVERSRTFGLPPLGVDRPLDPRWRDALQRIADDCSSDATPEVTRTLDALRSADAKALDDTARGLLNLDYPAVDAAQAPFVAAALQVHWTAMAQVMGESAFAPIDVPNVCPACGSPPVASVLAIDVPAPGTRYLHCALCGCEWYLPRGQCTSCEEREKVAYFHVEGGDEAVKAEACGACHGYLKVVNREKEPLADPVADDLASLALDVLMDGEAYQRAGPNLLFVPGSG